MLLLWTWLALVAAIASPALADQLTWQGAVEPDHVVLIEVLHLGLDAQGVPAEELAARFLSADGTTRTQAGWRPDIDPLPGQVRLEVPELWLGPGEYVQRVHAGGEVSERPLAPAAAPPRVLASTLPEGATGVRALRFTPGQGHDGWAFAPAIGTIAFLPVGDGAWSASVTGPPGDTVASEDIQPSTGSLSFQRRRAERERPAVEGHRWLIALGLAPVSLLVVLLAGFGLWRARRTRGLPLATAVALVLGLVAISSVLPDPSAALLMGGESFTDPPNSAALIAAIGDSFWRLSDVSDRFRYPEGHSWLVVGPSWLGYLPALPVAWLSDAVAAHNLGLAFGVVALFLTAWGLARHLGVGTIAALAAGTGAVMAPSLWAGLSTVSLDRITLFTVPVFFLCLEQAARRSGWRWPAAAGVALAAVFYGQVYYGIYLAVAAPLLVLWRLVGPAPLRRLGRLALVGLIAALLVGPGLLALRAGTADTIYADKSQTLSEQLASEGRSLFDPISDEEAEAFVDAHDRRRGDNIHRPTDTPKDLVLVAVTNSIRKDELIMPSSSLTGHGGYWLAALLGLVLATGAAGRRAAALRFSLDTLVLMVLAMGPMVRGVGGQVGALMPYYGLLVAIPGFEQLKHPDRFVLLAATISTLPIALGIDGLVRRLGRQPGVGRSAISAALTLGISFILVTFTLRGEDDKAGFMSLDTRAYLHRRHVDFSFRRPTSTAFPRSAALEQVEPGPALFLPLTVPTPEAQYVRALQAGMAMVNDPPHGSTAGGGPTAWVEENALLSRAAWLAGTDRPRRLLEPGGGDRDRAALRSAGLRWIVLVRSSLAGPELAAALEAWMDRSFQRVAEDDDVVVWSIAAPGGTR